MPRKNIENSPKMPGPDKNTDATYECVGPSEMAYEYKTPNSVANGNKKLPLAVDAPPLPPPLPPSLMKGNHQKCQKNSNNDSNDSLADSIDFNQADADLSLESDSGLEVVEEPTLRPSELVRGNNNRSMSIISGA